MLYSISKLFICSFLQVNSLNNTMEMSESPKLFCINILSTIKVLLGTLLPLVSVGQEEKSNLSVREKVSEQVSVIFVRDSYFFFLFTDNS